MLWIVDLVLCCSLHRRRDGSRQFRRGQDAESVALRAGPEFADAPIAHAAGRSLVPIETRISAPD